MFGKSSDDKVVEKQAKQEAKDKAALEKFGLDFDSYTEDELHRRNTDSVKDIATSLTGSKLYSFGISLTGDTNTSFMMEMERAQVEQNFILIRQNEEIIRLLKQIADK